mmetsp:Transcript_10967/g.30306  ORF Transcript_10967/g.30306 Transcript_10967/m.30306 type:complete len:224 (+) Transcript_10967:52-723(+)
MQSALLLRLRFHEHDLLLQTQELGNVLSQLLEVLVGRRHVLLPHPTGAIDADQIEGNAVGVFRRLGLDLLIGKELLGNSHSYLSHFEIVRPCEFQQSDEILRIDALLHVGDAAFGIRQLETHGTKGLRDGLRSWHGRFFLGLRRRWRHECGACRCHNLSQHVASSLRGRVCLVVGLQGCAVCRGGHGHGEGATAAARSACQSTQQESADQQHQRGPHCCHRSL